MAKVPNKSVLYAFDIEQYIDAFPHFSAVDAIGARIVDPGRVGYFPPELAITSKVGDTVTADFGVIKNVDTDNTIVVMELSYHIAKTEDNTNNPVTVTATLNGNPLILDPFNIEENVRTRVHGMNVLACSMFIVTYIP